MPLSKELCEYPENEPTNRLKGDKIQKRIVHVLLVFKGALYFRKQLMFNC
jgi:hypothetical protein